MIDTADTRRLALEIIATLVNIKKSAADQLLRPAGVPDQLVRRFLTERDASTGEKLSKRVAGTRVIEALAREGRDGPVVASLIEIASRWEAFHLAADEYKARAIVQKARDVQGSLVAEAEEEAARQASREKVRARAQASEKAAVLKQQSALLLQQFDHAVSKGKPHERGYLLQDLLNRLFDLHDFPVAKAFTRNDGGEQIDGAFEMEGWHYLVECRWRTKLSNMRELDGLIGQVNRSGRQTMGMFLSINGWSENVVPLLKQSPDKSIFLMDGYDLRCALDQQIDLRALLKAKIRALNLNAEPFTSAKTCT